MIGQTKHLAWSFTNVMADVQDLFVERIREPMNGGPPQYEFEGDWHEVTVRREEIAVKGRKEPEVLEVRETHHGPIVTDLFGPRGRGPAARAPVDRAALARLHADGVRRRLLGDSRRGARALRGVPRALHEHALGRRERVDRLQADRPHPDPPRRLPRPAEAGLDRRVRVGRLHPLRRPARGDRPARRRARDGEQPDRPARLPAPHHERLLRGLARRPDRAAPRRARAALARRLRAHPDGRLLDPRRDDRAPARAAARESRPRARPTRSTGSGTGTTGSTRARPRRRSTTRSRTRSPRACPSSRSATAPTPRAGARSRRWRSR